MMRARVDRPTPTSPLAAILWMPGALLFALRTLFR
jgi:hypothetical protein